MAVKVFITGIGGFIGGHLAEFLTERGYDVYGSFFRPTNDMEVVRKNSKKLFNVDVRYRPHIEDALSEVKPDIVYHLAGQSYPMESYKRPKYTLDTNTGGTLNLFDSMLALGMKDVRVLMASSTAAYGIIDPTEVPVKEDQPFRPAHVYGMSKAGQDLLATTYGTAHGMDIIRLRIGNCIGPRRRGEVVSDFTLRRAKIDLKMIPPRFRVGNLHTKRAFMDVRDAVKGFLALQEKGKGGEAYNISGMTAFSIHDLLDLVLDGCDPRPEIVRDPQLVRDVDELIYWNDLSKIIAATSWKPEIPLRKTVEDMVEWWKKTLL